MSYLAIFSFSKFFHITLISISDHGQHKFACLLTNRESLHKARKDMGLELPLGGELISLDWPGEDYLEIPTENKKEKRKHK